MDHPVCILIMITLHVKNSSFSPSLCPSRTYVIHAGTVISTKQPYRVVLTLFDTSKPAGGGGRLDAFLLQRALPATVSVRLSNRGSVIAEEMRECYPDTTVSVSFKVGHQSIHRLHAG